MEAVVGCAAVGLLLVCMGVWTAATKNPVLLHGYHRAATPPDKLPALARWSGAGLAVSGVGCGLLAAPDWLCVAGAVLLVAGLAVVTGAVVRFNGTLFSFGPTSDDRALVCGLLVLAGVVSLAATAVPGMLMLVSGDPSMLHGYHLANVAASDLPALARWEGASLVALGVGLSAALGAGAWQARRPFSAAPRALAAAGGVVLALSLVALLAGIIRFNGTLVG